MAPGTREPITIHALSIRQPWAWFLAAGHKDVENRSWPTRFRGRILIHAARGCTGAEWSEAAEFAKTAAGVEVPPLAQLDRGGFIGTMDIVDCVQSSPSPWFFGPYGFVIRDARPLPFVPWRGELGFFKVLLAGLPAGWLPDLGDPTPGRQLGETTRDHG